MNRMNSHNWLNLLGQSRVPDTHETPCGSVACSAGPVIARAESEPRLSPLLPMRQHLRHTSHRSYALRELSSARKRDSGRQ